MTLEPKEMTDAQLRAALREAADGVTDATALVQEAVDRWGVTGIPREPAEYKISVPLNAAR